MRKLRAAIARALGRAALRVKPDEPAVAEFFSDLALDMAVKGSAVMRVDPHSMVKAKGEEEELCHGFPRRELAYPRDMFSAIIASNSPYAFYLFQWVPYQKDAKQWRLKMTHDVKTFDGRVEHGIWPNGNHCGSFHDDEVEFIRISRNQGWHEYKDPRDEQ